MVHKKIKRMMALMYGLLLTWASLTLSFSSVAAPAVWQLSKDGKVNYLMGTVHMGDASMATLPEKVEALLQQVDNLIVEVNMHALSPQQVQNTMLVAASLPTGKTLQSVLTPATYKKLQVYAQSNGIELGIFKNFEPWFVGMTIAAMEFQKAGYSQEFGVDSVLMNYANGFNKKILQLETLEQQVGFLSVFKDADGEAFLLDGLNEMETIGNMTHNLINSYKVGDYQMFFDLYQQTMKNTEFDQKMEQVMLVQRNLNWIKQLSEQFNHQSSLVAVGAMHLIGDQGLLTLFEQNGWSVQKL